MRLLDTRSLVRGAAILAVGLAACASSPPPRSAAAPPKRPAPAVVKLDPDALTAQLLEAHNKQRAEEDRPPLKANPKLQEAARKHAQDMAEHEKMTHDGSDGSTAADRIQRAGYRYRRVGENVAEGQRSVAEVMESWMNSPPHRENILGDFEEMGGAVVAGDDGQPYWCVNFGTSFPQLDPSQAAEKLVAALNAARAEADKPPLKSDPKLAQAAQAHAQAMADQGKLRPSGPDPFRRVTQAGYRFRQLGMNSASGQPEPADVVASWMKGNGQRQGLLGDFADVGVGYATDSQGIPYWVVLLGVPR